MYVWLILAFIFAFLEALAVSKNVQRMEYVTKPAVMACLFLWLYSRTGLQGNALWFGLGILFSLIGDVLLMLPGDSMFLPGLIGFLLAHISYISGFREALIAMNGRAFVLAMIVIAINGLLLWRIVQTMRAKGTNNLVIPVILYGIVISVMLFAALSTIYNPAWKTISAVFVSVGAFLFCVSDAMLAWTKFVGPIKNGRVTSVFFYHLGQIGLIAGVISQLGKFM